MPPNDNEKITKVKKKLEITCFYQQKMNVLQTLLL